MWIALVSLGNKKKILKEIFSENIDPRNKVIQLAKKETKILKPGNLSTLIKPKADINASSILDLDSQFCMDFRHSQNFFISKANFH